LVGWAFTLGGLFMAVICALNCLGLARGRLRNDVGLSFNLGLGMVSAGLAGFFWDIGFTDGPVETWRFYWLDLGAFGLVLMLVSALDPSGSTHSHQPERMATQALLVAGDHRRMVFCTWFRA
jgi:hypothetical protein